MNENSVKRRVGTFTLGVSLIMYGLVMLYGVFVKEFDFLLAARLSPVIFILLGIEVLTAHFKRESFQYDVVSGVICVLLVSGSFVMAMLLALFQRYAW